MKFRIKKEYLLILLLLNSSLVLGIFILRMFTSRNTLVDIPAQERKAYLPYVNKTIEDLHINSKAFIIYDPASRVTVAGKNENLRFSPASSAKIMTATIVLENYALNKIIVARNVASMQGSKMGLVEGENITVQNLLYGLMLPSGNDAAHVLARNFNGGEEKFIEAMNKKAQFLSMENTKFYDPAGLEDANYTTAFDLARLASYSMNNPQFAKIVSTKKIKVYDTFGKVEHNLTNLNELLGTNGVNGVKTGFTDEAGEVLVTSIRKNDKNFIVVVLNSSDRFGDTNNIIRSAIKNLDLIFY